MDRDVPGKCKGFGFVEFETAKDLHNAIAMPEERFVLDGSERKLRVNLPKPKAGGDRQDRNHNVKRNKGGFKKKVAAMGITAEGNKLSSPTTVAPAVRMPV